MTRSWWKGYEQGGANGRILMEGIRTRKCKWRFTNGKICGGYTNDKAQKDGVQLGLEI